MNDIVDYQFAENGLTALKLGKVLSSESFINYVGEEKYKVLVKFLLHYIADLDIPIKRCVVPPRYFTPEELSAHHFLLVLIMGCTVQGNICRVQKWNGKVCKFFQKG